MKSNGLGAGGRTPPGDAAAGHPHACRAVSPVPRHDEVVKRIQCLVGGQRVMVGTGREPIIRLADIAASRERDLGSVGDKLRSGDLYCTTNVLGGGAAGGLDPDSAGATQ